MHSHLRNEAAFAPFSAHNTASSYPHPAAALSTEKRQRMSITQTYRLAHRARGKLSLEASRADHDLRLLVGHANLLDGLMLDLQEAEREQEAWFNQSIKTDEPKRVQWSPALVEQHTLDVPDEDMDDSDSDVSEDEDVDVSTTADTSLPEISPRRQRATSPPPYTIYEEDDEDEEMESDDEYDNLELSLVRTRSRSEPEMAVPELVHDHDSSDDDDDDSSPSSPQHLTAQHVTVKDFAAAQLQRQELQKDAAAALEDEGFYIPQQRQAPLVAAY